MSVNAWPSSVDGPWLIADGGLDSERKWIAQKFERKPGRRRDVVDSGRDRVIAQEPAADGIAHHAEIGGIVVDPIAAAQAWCGLAR